MRRILAVVSVLLFVGSTNAADDLQLSKSIAAATVIREAAPEEIEIEAVLNQRGEIVLTATLPRIFLENSVTKSPPERDGNRIGDWRVGFVVVPKLSQTELREIRRELAKIAESKPNLTHKGLFETNLADVESTAYAYRLESAYGIPTEEADRKKVQTFIANLSKSLRTTSEREIEELLDVVMLR